MISTQISRASAILLLMGGMALLFGADVILPRLTPDIPPTATWVGQLLGASWLGVASLNWHSQSLLLGGIYGRPVVHTNMVLYFVATMVLVNTVIRSDAPAAVWILLVPIALFAATYGYLLLRGPLGRDFEISRGTR